MIHLRLTKPQSPGTMFERDTLCGRLRDRYEPKEQRDSIRTTDRAAVTCGHCRRMMTRGGQYARYLIERYI